MDPDRRNRIQRAARLMCERYRFTVSGELRLIVIEAMWELADQGRAGHRPLFSLDLWAEKGGGVEKNLALADSLPVILAGYDAAVKTFPGRDVTVRTGARVIRSSLRDREG